MAAVTIDLALALGLVVVVPLALGLDRRRPLDPARIPFVAGAGLVAAGSLLLDEGLLAAALTIPWLVTAAIGALRHAVPVDARAWIRAAPAILPFAYAVAGAGWLLVSRYGGRPLDFGDTIVELTAIHFHYAGLVAPLLVLSLVRWLRLDGKSGTAARASLVAVLAATPLTAAGITFEPALGAAGAVAFACGLTTASLLTLTRVLPKVRRTSRVLLGISSASVIASMALAVAYAFGQWLGTPSPSLQVMANTHGVLNAVGFALAGVLGWSREQRRGAPEGAPL